MSPLTVGLLFIVSIGVNAEQCRYEFIVPEGNCMQTSETNPVDPKISVMHIQTDLEITNARFNSMAAQFTKEMTTLDFDTKHLKEITTGIQTKLATVQENLSEVKDLKEEVKAMKESLTDTTNSLNPQLAGLREKMVSIISKVESQASIYKSLQEQLQESSTTIGQQSRDIENLKHSAESIVKLENKMAAISQRSPVPESTEFQERIDSIEDKVKSISDQDITSIKNALNLLQSQFLENARQCRQKILSLEGTINLVSSRMEVMRRGQVQK